MLFNFRKNAAQIVYNKSSRELYTSDGKLLKKLDCPLNKNWKQLTVVESKDRVRQCHSCGKSVVNLTGKSEQEIKEMLRNAPETCVYIAPKARNVRITQFAYDGRRDDPCPFRRIATARGKEAINEAAQAGFRPLVKLVVRNENIQSWMVVFQNEETGEIRYVSDSRESLYFPWKRVTDRIWFYPHQQQHPIAAYLLPLDLQPGERVFLTDLIEDLLGWWSNQEHKIRIDSAYAIWNGTDFLIEWDEERDAAGVVG